MIEKGKSIILSSSSVNNVCNNDSNNGSNTSDDREVYDMPRWKNSYQKQGLEGISTEKKSNSTICVANIGFFKTYLDSVLYILMNISP